MGIEPWDVVLSGIALDVADGRLARMEVCWRITPTGGRAEVIVVDRGGDPLAYDLGPGFVEAFKAYLFSDAPGGGQQTRAVPDPVNIDGSPRNGLRDRMARRGFELETMAAD